MYYGYYHLPVKSHQSNHVYLLQLEATEIRLFVQGHTRLEAAAAKQLLNYTCMPNPLANATFLHHHEAIVDC